MAPASMTPRLSSARRSSRPLPATCWIEFPSCRDLLIVSPVRLGAPCSIVQPLNALMLLHLSYAPIARYSILRGSAAQHQMDGLGLRVAQQLIDAFFAPEPAVLVATERRAVEMTGRAVDPDIAGLNSARGPEGGVEIVGEDRGGQAVLGRIGECERFFLVAPAEHREHRPEDFLARDPHARLHVGEHRRLEPIAALEFRAGRTLAAGHQPRALGFPRLHHGADAL